MPKCVLLEGIPGAGKTTMCNRLREGGFAVNVVPDIGNPATLDNAFFMDYVWVLDVECLKSRLARRARASMSIQERGYLSVLAFHWSAHDGSYERVRDELLRRFRVGAFIPPDVTVVFPLPVELSGVRQPDVRMPVWRDVSMLNEIQKYYATYCADVLFGERVVMGMQDMSLDAFVQIVGGEHEG